MVDDVWEDAEGGLNVRLAMTRPDGGVANATTIGDDSGFLFTLSHLSKALVRRGEPVNRGEVVALSGSTGESTGPHVHVQAEYLNDAPVWSLDNNQRVFVDPEALFTPTIEANDVMAAQVAPRGQEAAATPTTVIVRGDGAVQIGNGTAVNAPLKPVFNIHATWDAIKGAAGAILGPQGAGTSSNPPMPDAARGAFNSVLPGVQGAINSVLPGITGQAQAVAEVAGRGIGVLADQAVKVALDPNGLPLVVQVAGSALGIIGGVLPVLGTAASVVAGPAAAIPYVGGVASAGLSIFGGVAQVAGPVLGVVGGGVSAAGAGAREAVKAVK